MEKKLHPLQPYFGLPKWEFDINVAVCKATGILNARINDLRHLMNDQLIELKYGKGYKAKFLDEILIEVEKL